jgi:hypothetical protein
VVPGRDCAQQQTCLRQRPARQADLPQRSLVQGFSTDARAETITLSDAVPVQRVPPLHFAVQAGVADAEGERTRRRALPSEYLAGPLLVSRLPGALVDTSRFIVCPDEETYLLDSFRHPRGLVRWGYRHVAGDVYERPAEPIEERAERVVVLGAQAHRNYSHWLLESVVRALLFAPLDEGEILYLTPRLEPWQRQALTVAGVPGERILTLPRRRLVRFAEVVAVSRGFVSMPALIPGAVSALAGLASAATTGHHATTHHLPTTGHHATTGHPTTAGRRLFASRARTERRHIANEHELTGVLTKHGFATVYSEQLTIEQQIALFAGAEAVVGSFGSNLTNLIFSPAGTLVVELQPEDLDRGGATFQWNLASICGQRFAQVVCPVSKGMRERPLGERDMTVDVGAIDELLSDLLS